ncbi:Putative negative regulator of RcsB-dependent stress response [Nitrosomonas cryotolerans]|uniref:Putative negative regulator of RcsB-dependent stress response n=1 Tax=Nitrosomonas cryotolerans ATCC 49181 TaxID=1131553 RepID=A0A1N6IT76_9PROT|nr:tetratricopeptide repeat protein [Nitrosomonas cryotolerans]SFP32891.1 Putative negative regulator of RcsB-dependent stress response [Nitrosomonas cryotolerans]SIO35229.1 Putative negative regulator of RcsB-dependent stress response [Nitrosomonas cryotolerans ATCC 49181]
MATYNLEEQEKIDGLKSWWDSYGASIVIVASVLIATIAGTQAWKYYHTQQAEQAADLYGLLQQVQLTEDARKIDDAAHLLMAGFPSSGYASRAAMIAARASVAADDIKRAKEQLQWVIDHTEEYELKDLARLRLAGLLLDEKKYNEAAHLLEADHGTSFSGLYADRKGDVLSAAGKLAEARRAYQIAIDRLNKNNTYHSIVQMKLDALGEEAK